MSRCICKGFYRPPNCPVHGLRHVTSVAIISTEVDSLRKERDLLREWAKDAIKVINHGVELMPLNQLSKWTGVRAILEDAPE